MMKTWEEYARETRAWGIPLDEARRDWELQANDERARLALAERARAEAENPSPAFDWTHADLYEAQLKAQMDHDMDPLRAHRAAQERARIEAQVRPLIAQRDELTRQLAALDEEWRRWL